MPDKGVVNSDTNGDINGEILEINMRPVSPQHDHAGHRRRMKDRVLQFGLESLADHEVLEVLLYFAVPRSDTNALAHRLLRQFGSLSQVLEADMLDLQRLCGLSHNTAFLLKFSAQLAGRYLRDKNRSRQELSDTQKLKEYASGLYVEQDVEVAYMLCMDSQLHLRQLVKLSEGTVSGVNIHVPQVVENALRHKARHVVLIHNHPGGRARISTEDFNVTKSCLNALSYVQINLLDHIVVCGTECISFVEKNYIDTIRRMNK